MTRMSAEQRHRICLVLNDNMVDRVCEPRMLLSDFIRHEIGATGTHVGCEHGVCGACTVVVDGRPARACLTLALQVEGCEVRTVESLADQQGRLSSAVRLPAESRTAMRVLHCRHFDVA
jgi:2-furoyl-CoA dehydrogenase 2Fe-2S iron sulfur subunit